KFAPEAAAPGDIVMEDGTVVGRHEGIVGYTVGQRKGLPGGFAEPIFVVRIDPDNKQVIVGPRSSLGRRAFYLKEVNWLGNEPLEALEGTVVWVKVRAQHEPARGVIFWEEDGRLRVVLDEAEEQVSPGQAGVLYDETGVMLGGGWITLAGAHEALPLPEGRGVRVEIVG
ncbi:MAG: hypothetical protein COY40_03285, partial [Alphaproteobacteria bacterium CG_4_10_14_0_8_um_filter_53_9]